MVVRKDNEDEDSGGGEQKVTSHVWNKKKQTIKFLTILQV